MEALSGITSVVLWMKLSQAFTLFVCGKTRFTKNKPVPSFGKGNIIAGMPMMEQKRTCGLEQ